MIERVRIRLLRSAGRQVARLIRAWMADVHARARRRPLWDDVVLYESFAGNGALDNPEAIFRCLLAAPDLSHLRHIWVLTAGHRAFRDEFRGSPRVRIVRYRSAGYFRALARARTLINNATFPPEFDKRPGQFYLNTWHGTPLKHMGYDMPDGALQSANVLRNLVATDVLLSQSGWMTERMYLGAYRLRGIYGGRILEVGYPRMDRQEMSPADAERLAASLGGGASSDQKLVVYAPTWTGETFAAPRDEADALVATVEGLQRRIGSGFRVVLKAHQSVHHLLAGRGDAADVLIPNDLPTNVLLGATDHLITDFSSIFFDFLPRDLPITFYVPDPGRYRDERGAYFADEELPGAVVDELDDLAERIREDRDPFEDRRRAWAERFTPHSDGHAAERVIDVVFRGAPARSAGPGDARIPVLLYLGGMRSNGITSSALNLLRHLDHDRLDVSVLIARPRSSQQRANQALIDPRVRQFMRVGGMNGTKSAMARLKLRERVRPDAPENENQRRLYAGEWHRLVADSRFQAVVDFSGYSRFWTQLVLHSPPARRSIWLHNEMAAEVYRLVGGRRPMRRSLPAVFALYPRFDALVSVSPELARVNREALAAPGGPRAEAFTAVRNVIDEERVHSGARQSPPELEELGDPEPPEWLGALGDPGLTWFLTVGRLSPEKNQQRLLEAFARVRAAHRGARLLLVGDGPERARLAAEIRRLGLDESAFLAGAVANPFSLMAAADCFVLSSDYEGQPMVLLEAATLGMPIITTDFRSVRDALPGASITVVPSTPDALAAAMSAFLGGATNVVAFDPNAYNRAAIREAETVILGVDGVASSSASSSIMAPTSASTPTAHHVTTARTTTAPIAMPITHHMRASDRSRASTAHDRPQPPRTL
jgi:CDP-glycerol glycerophosphotransferase (TagB/SpsB family)/glycosyltransferase involved in cell wall biosynthesis